MDNQLIMNIGYIFITLLIVSLMVVIGISNAKSKPKPVGNNNQVKVQENILTEKVAEDKKKQKRKYEENRYDYEFSLLATYDVVSLSRFNGNACYFLYTFEEDE